MTLPVLAGLSDNTGLIFKGCRKAETDPMTQLLKHLPENTQGRDFVVGDLHGYYDALEQKLQECEFDPRHDRLLAVGDLIDRGPDSVRCLELVKEPWFFSVQGNHERFFLRSLAGDANASRILQENGGGWMLLYSDEELAQLAALIEEKMPLAMEVPWQGRRLGILHAEVPEDDWHCLPDSMAALSPRMLEVMVSQRSRLRQQRTDPVHNIDAIACGHTIVERPIRLGNVHYLETGICVPQLQGYLTLVELPRFFASDWLEPSI